MKNDGGGLLERMKLARKAAATIKYEILKLSASIPGKLIFAFEGIDDKLAYSQWIPRISSKINYEPFVCDGKSGIFDLVGVVDRDRGVLKQVVRFFLDRDFDQHHESNEREEAFFLPAYSIENILVSAHTLDEILVHEFHCHAAPEHRKEICLIFETVYAHFLEITRELNFKLFVSRRSKVNLTGSMPSKLKNICELEIDSVRATSECPSKGIDYQPDPGTEDLASFRKVFDQLNPKTDFRGKFAWLFFRSWLERLALDRSSENPKLFERSAYRVRVQEIGIAVVASRSMPPVGLDEFLRRWEPVNV